LLAIAASWPQPGQVAAARYCSPRERPRARSRRAAPPTRRLVLPASRRGRCTPARDQAAPGIPLRRAGKGEC
jgi:hypothetical protein